MDRFKTFQLKTRSHEPHQDGVCIMEPETHINKEEHNNHLMPDQQHFWLVVPNRENVTQGGT